MTKEIETFFIHFDTRGNDGEVIHQISLETFIKTSQSLRKILDGLNQEFFNKKLEDIEILVLPPEDGGLLQKLAFIITTLSACTILPIISEISIGAYTEITGEEPKETGQTLIKLVKKFLETDNDELQNKKIIQRNFPKSFAGRSDFYNACIADDSIKGVEFCKDYQFITRSKFINFCNKPIENKLLPEYKIHKLAILLSVTNKPSKKKGKETKLNWKGQDTTNKKILEFSLEDGNFNTSFINGKYPLDGNLGNVMIADFVYHKVEVDGEIDPKKTRIVATKVYYFNKEIIKIPDNLKIITVGESGETKNSLEPDLFSSIKH